MQAKLHKKERQANVKDAFAVKGNVKEKAFIIVDDTITTGATTRECAIMLKRAGASWVWIMALAQA